MNRSSHFSSPPIFSTRDWLSNCVARAPGCLQRLFILCPWDTSTMGLWYSGCGHHNVGLGLTMGMSGYGPSEVRALPWDTSTMGLWYSGCGHHNIGLGLTMGMSGYGPSEVRAMPWDTNTMALWYSGCGHHNMGLGLTMGMSGMGKPL
jgi:hypothetical protein